MGALCEKLTLAKAQSLIEKLVDDKDLAITHDNLGKAAVIDGEIKGIQRMILAIESGDLSK